MTEGWRARRRAAAAVGLIAFSLVGCTSDDGSAVSTAEPAGVESSATSIDPTITITTTTEALSAPVDPAAVAAYLESITPAAGPKGLNTAPASRGDTGSAPAGSGSAPAPAPIGTPFIAPTVTVDYTCIDSYPRWGFSAVVTASGGSGWRLNDVSAPGGVIATSELYVHKPGDFDIPGGEVQEFPANQEYVHLFPFYEQTNGPLKSSISVSKPMSCTFHLSGASSTGP